MYRVTKYGCLLACAVCLMSPIKTHADTRHTAFAGATKVVAEMSTQSEAVKIPTVEENKVDFVEMGVPTKNAFKSYMDAKFITDKTSDQYALKSSYENSASGIWLVDGRYVVAVGSYYTVEIGTRLDVVMENGSILRCIVGDCKADAHTDSTNRQNPNGSIVEFIVDTPNLDGNAKLHGDISFISEEFKGEIKAIRVYTQN